MDQRRQKDRKVKIITDQHKLNHTRGSYGPLGNVSANGCGMLALYNALQLLGHDISYDGMYRHVRKYWWKTLLLGGLLGTNPIFVFGQLKRITGRRLSWKTYFGKDNEAEWMRPGIYLILYLHRCGAHYAAAQQTTEQLLVYNDIRENHNLPDYYRKIRAKGMLIVRLDVDEV